MLFADVAGGVVAVEADVAPLAGLSDDAIDRARDVWMLALSDGGMDHRTIGRIFGVSQSTVSRRLKAIPPQAIAYFRRERGAVSLPMFGED